MKIKMLNVGVLLAAVCLWCHVHASTKSGAPDLDVLANVRRNRNFPRSISEIIGALVKLNSVGYAANGLGKRVSKTIDNVHRALVSGMAKIDADLAEMGDGRSPPFYHGSSFDESAEDDFGSIAFWKRLMMKGQRKHQKDAASLDDSPLEPDEKPTAVALEKPSAYSAPLVKGTKKPPSPATTSLKRTASRDDQADDARRNLKDQKASASEEPAAGVDEEPAVPNEESKSTQQDGQANSEAPDDGVPVFKVGEIYPPPLEESADAGFLPTPLGSDKFNHSKRLGHRDEKKKDFL